MKKSRIGKLMLVGVTFLAPVAVTAPAQAQIGIQVGIALPPPIVFAAPPLVVALPQMDVYVVPDVSDDIYFSDGFWWRPWQGRWYRSQYYDRGWGYYSDTPSFYGRIPGGWRNDYSNHRWNGQQWNYERMPHARVEQNWSGWKRDKHWQSEKNWGGNGNHHQQDNHGQQRQAAQPDHRSNQPSQMHRSNQQQAPKSAPRAQQPKSHKQSAPRAQQPQAHQQRNQKPQGHAQHAQPTGKSQGGGGQNGGGQGKSKGGDGQGHGGQDKGSSPKGDGKGK